MELSNKVTRRNNDGMGALKTEPTAESMEVIKAAEGEPVDDSMITVDLENANIDDLLDVIERNKGKHRLRDFSWLREEADFLGVVGRATRSYSGRNLLSFQKQPIKNSLCRFTKESVAAINESLDAVDVATGHTLDHREVASLAVALFSKILQFQDVRERQSTLDKVSTARYILRMGRQHHAVRDEIFAQILKQIADCHSARRRALGWKLLYLCCASFRASPEMSAIVLSAICGEAQHIERLDSFRNITETATNCYKAWRALSDRPKGPSAAATDKTGFPTPREMAAIIESDTELLRLEVFLFDDTRLRVQVQPLWTLRDLTDRLCARFGLSEWSNHFTLRITANEDGRGLMGDLNVDAMRGGVQVKHWYERWRDIKRVHPVLRFKLTLFKWRYQWTLDSADRVAVRWEERKRYIHVLYWQLVAMVNDGGIRIGRDDHCFLSAIKLLVDHNGVAVPRQDLTDRVIVELIPYRMRADFVKFEEMKEQIFAHLESVDAISGTKGPENEDAVFRKVMGLELKYIKYLAENAEMYGISYFRVRVVAPKGKYEENGRMLMGVGWDRVCLCHYESSEGLDVLDSFDLRKVEKLTNVPEMKQLTFLIARVAEQDEPVEFRIESPMIDVLSRMLTERVAHCGNLH